MAEINVVRERETEHGWSFEVSVRGGAGPPTLHTVLLSWQDYERWARGALPPARVASALVRFLVREEGAASIPPKFDASTARRRRPDLDAALGALL